MKLFQKILVPTDFSNHSVRAQDVAIDLACRYESAIDLVHVYQAPNYMMPEGYVIPTAEQTEAMLAEIGRLLNAAQDKARAAGVKQVETTVLQGRTVDELVAFARTHHNDLIVMGTHGRSGFSHLLLGSVAEHVVRSAPCPVMTVHLDAAKK